METFKGHGRGAYYWLQVKGLGLRTNCLWADDILFCNAFEE